MGKIYGEGRVTMEITAFSQRDARWAAEMLGTGEQRIGQVGCLISAVASMLATWGVATDPHRLNAFLLRSYGYVDGNLFVFGAVDGLGCRFVEFIDCATVAAPVARLQAAISGGAGVICQVDATPGGKVDRHWVWLYGAPDGSGGSGGSDGPAGWQIVDPWRLPGHERIDLGAYLAKGWTPARGIFAAAIYERLADRVARAWRSTVEAHQEAVCVREDGDGR